MASNAENVSIWWRHHGCGQRYSYACCDTKGIKTWISCFVIAPCMINKPMMAAVIIVIRASLLMFLLWVSLFSVHPSVHPTSVRSLRPFQYMIAKVPVDHWITWMNKLHYRKTSNIRRTLVGNKIVDHSDVVGASPVGAAPTTSSFST